VSSITECAFCGDEHDEFNQHPIKAEKKVVNNLYGVGEISEAVLRLRNEE